MDEKYIQQLYDNLASTYGKDKILPYDSFVQKITTDTAFQRSTYDNLAKRYGADKILPYEQFQTNVKKKVGGETATTTATPSVSAAPSTLKGNVRDVMAQYGTEQAPAKESTLIPQASYQKDLVKQQALQKSKEYKQAAVENTAKIWAENNPTKFTLAPKPKEGAEKFTLQQLNTLPAFERKKAELSNAIDNGQLIIAQGSNGQPIVARDKGALASFVGGFKDAWNQHEENVKINEMSKDEFLKYADDLAKKQPEEYLPEKANPKSFSYQAGESVPLVGRAAIASGAAALGTYLAPATLGTSLEGAAPIISWAATVPYMAEDAGAQSLLNNYFRALKENPNMSKDDAYAMAKNASIGDRAKAVAMGTALNYTGGSILPKGTGTGLWKAVGEFAKEQPESLAKVGGVAGLSSFARDMYMKGLGYKVDEGEMKSSAGQEMWGMATTQLAFNILHGLIPASKAEKSQAKEVLIKSDPETLRQLQERAVQNGELTQEQTDAANKDLADYKKASSKIPENQKTNDEKDAVIAGLIQKKNNLEEAKKNVDPVYHKELDQQIEQANQRIELAKNSKDPIKYAEQDDITGQPNFTPKSFDELSKSEVKGIEVPKDYGNIEIIEKGEGDNKTYSAKVTLTEGGKGLAKPEIKIEENTFNDKSKAKEAAEDALREHYYENDMLPNLKPESKSAVTVIKPNENKAPEIIPQQTNEGVVGETKPIERTVPTSEGEVIQQPTETQISTETKPTENIQQAEKPINELSDYEIAQEAIANNNIDNPTKAESERGIELYKEAFKRGIANKLSDILERGKSEQPTTKITQQAEALKKEDLPQEQNRTDTDATQKILDYAAEIYNVPKINLKENKNYTSWLQNLGDAGYEAANKLNAPQLAYDILSKAKSEQPTPTSTIEDIQGKEQPTETEVAKINTEQQKASTQVEPQESGVYVQYPPTQLSYAGTGKIETEFGIPEREPTETKHDIQTIKEADQLIEKGWKPQDAIDRVEKGLGFISDAEYINLTRYAAELSDRLRGMKDVLSPEYDATLNELNRVAQTANSAGKETGRALGIRGRFKTIADGSYADFMLTELNANKDAPLTPNQKATALTDYNEFQEAKKNYEARITELEAKLAERKAQIELEKQKSTTAIKPKVKKTHEDFVKERESARDKIKAAKEAHEKWLRDNGIQKAGISPFVLTKEMVAPIKELVSSYVEEGVTKLSDITKKVVEDIKDLLPEITEKHIHDVIAGVYNEQKQTKSEVAIQKENLRIEAQLLNRLENLINGTEPKTEKAKIKRNQEIEDLQKQIRDWKKDNPDKEGQLKNLKAKNERETKRIQEKIDKGDFAPDEKKKPILEDAEVKAKYPELYKEVVKSKDALIKKRNEIALRRAKQMYENKTPSQRFSDNLVRGLNIPRTLMSSMDFSAPLRQGIVASIANPKLALAAAKFMFKAAGNEALYNRWIDEVHNSPRWNGAEKSGLGVTDPATLHLAQSEEAFLGANYAEQLPLGVGAAVKGSERAYIGFLNKMRWDLYNMYADRFEQQGKTADNNPELYKSLASFVNAATGRGGMGALEKGAPLLNSFIFSPRLIASRINMLGLTDIPNLLVRAGTFGKRGVDYGFYTKLPKELRIEAAKDMLKFLATGITTLGLFKAASKAYGGDIEVEDDPRSSDFGKIKSGNTRWDIWGGFQPYARLLAQLITAQRKSAATGKVYELEGKGAFGTDRGDVLSSFLRGKLAPVPSAAWDIIKGRTVSGEKVNRTFDIPFYPADNPKEGITITDELWQHVAPLLINDVSDAMKEKGISGLFTAGVPSVFGVGVQTYEPKATKHKTKSSSDKTIIYR